MLKNVNAQIATIRVPRVIFWEESITADVVHLGTVDNFSYKENTPPSMLLDF